MSSPSVDHDPDLAKPPVRQASADDREATVATVAAAFVRDPAWAFLLGEGYERLAPRFAGALFDLRVISGGVWIAGNCLAVAMWDAPGGAGSSVRAQAVWDEYAALAGNEVHERLVHYNQAVGAASPEESYWYLGVLATHPDHRCRGLASAVLAPTLAKADRDDLACCLETSTESNRSFYEARGFTEATEVVLEGGPPTWWLRRPPAPSAVD
jgi:GNAT superfamily N-acetyltransferase